MRWCRKCKLQKLQATHCKRDCQTDWDMQWKWIWGSICRPWVDDSRCSIRWRKGCAGRCTIYGHLHLVHDSVANGRDEGPESFQETIRSVVWNWRRSYVLPGEKKHCSRGKLFLFMRFTGWSVSYILGSTIDMMIWIWGRQRLSVAPLFQAPRWTRSCRTSTWAVCETPPTPSSWRSKT